MRARVHRRPHVGLGKFESLDKAVIKGWVMLKGVKASAF